MPPTALSFLSREKRQGRKACWDAFGACCGYNSGEDLNFSPCEHTKSPYVRCGTRRLLWCTKFVNSCDSISAVKSLAFETCRVVRIHRSSFWCRTGAGAPLAYPGGSWLRSEAEQTDAVEAVVFCLRFPKIETVPRPSSGPSGHLLQWGRLSVRARSFLLFFVDTCDKIKKEIRNGRISA